MGVIDYEKYSNMTQRQLLNSLLNAEKKEAKLKAELQEKIKNSSELIQFLKVKLKESLDKPKGNFIPYAESESYKIAKEYEATLSDEQKKEAIERVEKLTNRNYGDEL